MREQAETGRVFGPEARVMGEYLGCISLSDCSLRAGTYLLHKGVCRDMGKRMTRRALSEGFRKVPEVLHEYIGEVAEHNGMYCCLEVHVDTASDPALRMTGECVSVSAQYLSGKFETMMIGVEFQKDPKLTAAVKEAAFWRALKPMGLPIMGPSQPKCVVIAAIGTDADNTITCMKNGIAGRLGESAQVLDGDALMYKLPDVGSRLPVTAPVTVTAREQDDLVAMITGRGSGSVVRDGLSECELRSQA
jgi:hypothetical protein